MNLTSCGAKPICAISTKQFLILLFILFLSRCTSNLCQEQQRSKQAASCKEDAGGDCNRIGREEGSRETIERTFFRKLYDSKLCMKGDPKVVAQRLKQLTSESAKRDALKNNIYIRTMGFSWNLFHITMIHNWQNTSIRELADHLQMIIRKEKDMDFPDRPPVDLPQHYPLPILGNMTDEVRQLDMKYFESEERIREVAK